MKFEDLALRAEIQQAVKEAGYTTPTPIQAQAIPAILEGHDLIGIAQTGTGKTAAFVLPMVERLAQGQAKARMPRSMILSPTRELATQTSAYFETYGKHLKLSKALLIGGVGMEDQARQLERGVDVLIATPGRLIDQFERGRILLGGISILVIDEADRMLDMGFIPDVERIVKLLVRRDQTLLFSATMPKEIRRLADAFLTDPKQIEATRPATRAEQVDDRIMVVQPRQKFKALRRLIESQDVDKAIIFCNRKREVSSLRRQLERAGMNVRDIHGDLDQSQRTDALDAFKRGDVAFLVATDVAARGLDIASLPCVINYDVPTHADDYIHRIGRTGRAGKEGRAFTLALPEDNKFLSAITRLVGKAIPHIDLEALPAAGSDGAPATNGASEPVAPQEGRRRSRRQRSADPATAQPDVAQTDSPQPVPADSAPAQSAPPQPTASQPGPANASHPKPGARRSGRPERSAGRPAGRQGGDRPEPVVGLGDHVPLFLLRPVPSAVLRDPGED